MKKALTWRSVAGGIAAFAAIALTLLVVFRYARTGVLRGDKFVLYVAVPDASNVLKGSDVWLNGQRVGTVTDIAFAPATAPLDARVVIRAEVLTRMRDNIRLDSRADLRSGGTVIGAPVVYLSAGTIRARAVAPGDTLRGAGKSDFEIAASQATEALAEMPGVAADVKVIAANAKTAGARVRAIAQEGGRSSFAARSQAFLRKLSAGNGTASRLRGDERLRAGIARARAGSDSLRQLLSSRAAEVGRFRRDSTLARSVRKLRDDVASLRALAASDQGTVGRLRADSALVHGLDSLFAELNALMMDMKKNPLRYARVF